MGAPNGLSEADSNQDKPSSKPSVLGIPLAGWAVAAVSVIFVGYVAAHYGLKVYQEGAMIHQGESTYSKAVTDEMVAHQDDKSGERQMLHRDAAGEVWATYFSDGCIAIQRPGQTLPYLTQPEANVEWSLAPSRRPHTKAPHLPNASPLFGITGAPVTMDGALQGGTVPGGVAMAGLLDPGMLPGPFRPVQAGCLNPHPWPFQGWWGQANGCWVPFWRRWNDGCTHYEMYNTCSGQWDPQIIWTFCAAQHHS